MCEIGLVVLPGGYPHYILAGTSWILLLMIVLEGPLCHHSIVNPFTKHLNHLGFTKHLNQLLYRYLVIYSTDVFLEPRPCF